jgi:hypothetical protein
LLCPARMSSLGAGMGWRGFWGRSAVGVSRVRRGGGGARARRSEGGGEGARGRFAIGGGMVLARACRPVAPDRGSGKRRASRRAGADRARFASGHALELALHPDDPRVLGAGAHDARRATASPAKDSEGGGRTRGERARVRAFFHARGFDSMASRDKSRRVRGSRTHPTPLRPSVLARDLAVPR